MLGGICQGIYALAFSSDGRWFATGGADRMVQIGNAETLEWLATFPIGGWVQDLAFSPNSQRLAAASRSDNAGRVWDVESRSLLHDVKGHVREVLAVAFLDDQRLVSSSLYGDMKLWDLDNLPDPRIVSGHFYRLTYSATGDMLFAASMSGQIQVFDARSGKAVVRKIGAGEYTNAAFSDNGHWAATIDSNRTLRVWALAKDQIVLERQVSGDALGRALGMAVNRSGDKVAWDEAIGDGRHKIAFSDLKSMTANDFMGPPLPKVLAWGAPLSDCHFLAFFPDGRSTSLLRHEAWARRLAS